MSKRIKGIIRVILISVILIMTCVGCGSKPAANVSTSAASTGISTSADISTENQIAYTKADIKKLKNTENFNSTALEHIFNGSVNSSGNASGYHYDMIVDSDGKIVGSKSKADANGVYTAKVEVKGKAKTGNKGTSTFYPDRLSPQEVVDLINEAYADCESVSGNTYSGEAGGITINMYLDDNKKIISAFPVMD